MFFAALLFLQGGGFYCAGSINSCHTFKNNIYICSIFNNYRLMSYAVCRITYYRNIFSCCHKAFIYRTYYCYHLLCNSVTIHHIPVRKFTYKLYPIHSPILIYAAHHSSHRSRCIPVYLRKCIIIIIITHTHKIIRIF